MSDETESPGRSHRLSRRRLLQTSATAGVTASAGCVGRFTDDDGDTVFIFNTGDMTVSLIDPADDEVVTTTHLGATSSFPSNQYSPRLADGSEEVLWLNVGEGVRAIRIKTLETVAEIETGSDANWLERTPNGEHLVVSAREPSHRQFRIDADPSSEEFGAITGEIDRSDEDGIDEQDGPGPCDITFEPDGEYGFVPDLYGNSLTVLRVDPFEIVTQVEVDPLGDAEHAQPWMGTAGWNGEILLIENNEGEGGTESIWDVSDSESPEELARLTSEDGLGEGALTSEIGPDDEVAYVFTPGSEDVSVIDIEDREVTDRLDLGGQAFAGTWDPAREKLYIPVQTADEVAVIDNDERAIVERISVGSGPNGATASSVRPDGDSIREAMAALASLGVIEGGEPTHCVGDCYCTPNGT